MFDFIKSAKYTEYILIISIYRPPHNIIYCKCLCFITQFLATLKERKGKTNVNISAKDPTPVMKRKRIALAEFIRT